MLCKKFVYPTFSYKGSFALFDVVVGQSELFFGEECLDGNPRDGFGAVGVNSRSVRESCGRKNNLAKSYPQRPCGWGNICIFAH